MTDTHRRERTDARPRGSSLTINLKSGGIRGYTLVEMMIVLVVMGVMISFGIPQFSRALEQSRADVAGANLRAIWTAERIYWLEYRNYAPNLPWLASNTPPLQTTQNAGYPLLDPSIVPGSSCPLDPYYSYQVQVPAVDGTPFTATAQRIGSGSWSGTLAITQDGTFTSTSTLTCPGQAPIVVGFQ